MHPVTHTRMLLWVYAGSNMNIIQHNTYTGSLTHYSTWSLGHVNLSSFIDSSFQQRSTLCPILLQTINPDREILLSTVSTICPKWRWSDLNYWKLFSSGSFDCWWCINHFVWTSQCVSRTEYGYKLLARVPWQMNDQSHKIAFAIWRIWLDFD